MAIPETVFGMVAEIYNKAKIGEDLGRTREASGNERLPRLQNLLETWYLLVDCEDFMKDWGEENYKRVQEILEKARLGELKPIKELSSPNLNGHFTYRDAQNQLTVQNFIDPPDEGISYSFIRSVTSERPVGFTGIVWGSAHEEGFNISYMINRIKGGLGGGRKVMEKIENRDCFKTKR